jgi:hypothetical protein
MWSMQLWTQVGVTQAQDVGVVVSEVAKESVPMHHHHHRDMKAESHHHAHHQPTSVTGDIAHNDCCLNDCDCSYGHCAHWGMVSDSPSILAMVPVFTRLNPNDKPNTINSFLLRPPTTV